MDYYFAQGHQPFRLKYNHPRYEKYVIGEKHEGDNIDGLNRLFSEYCQMYYVWKNRKFNDNDVLTFCHYSRQINPKHVSVKMVEEGGIQVYYLHPYDEKITEGVHYCHVYNLLNWFRVPSYIYEDFEGYLDSQDMVPNKTLMDYFNAPKSNFHNRIIFSIRYDMFVKMMEFLNGYIEYIAKKHNLKSMKDWIVFYKDSVIEHLRTLDNSNLSVGRMFYQGKGDFNKIYNWDYGFNGKCNCWRTYAYIFEHLVSAYIDSKKYFYTVKYPD